MEKIIYSEHKQNYHSHVMNGDIDLEQVLEFAKNKHKGQKRKGGEEYIIHPIRVADIVKKFKKSSKHLDLLVSAAYLHDVLEDTYTSYKEIEDNFGNEVASLVLEVTTSPIASDIFGKRDYLLSKMKNMTPYALFLKLADRLDNISDTEGCSVAWLESYLDQTKYIIDNLKKEVKFSNAQKGLIKEIEKILR